MTEILNILCKNCNSSSTGRHAKLSKRKFDFNIQHIFTSTSLLFIERHDQFFVLNRIWTEVKVHIFQNIASTTHITKGLRLQKMKTGVKKKKMPKCLAGCQPLHQKLGFSIPLQLRKIKNLILRFGQRPLPQPQPTLLKNVSYFSPSFLPPRHYVFPKKNKL